MKITLIKRYDISNMLEEKHFKVTADNLTIEELEAANKNWDFGINDLFQVELIAPDHAICITRTDRSD